jgi:hypothetical protein
VRTRQNLRNEPKTSQLATINGRFDIWTIFVRAMAAGGIRGSDVLVNIGEIPRRKDVTGHLAPRTKRGDARPILEIS